MLAYQKFYRNLIYTKSYQHIWLYDVTTLTWNTLTSVLFPIATILRSYCIIIVSQHVHRIMTFSSIAAQTYLSGKTSSTLLRPTLITYSMFFHPLSVSVNRENNMKGVNFGFILNFKYFYDVFDQNWHFWMKNLSKIHFFKKSFRQKFKK